MIVLLLPARSEIDADVSAGYGATMTNDPDKVAERRRLLQENAQRMHERWQQAEDDLYNALCERLRVRYLPVDCPSADDIKRYELHLARAPTEKSAAVRAMSDEDAELFSDLEVARTLYVDPVDRESGITPEKVARYPERYRSSNDD